MFGFGELPRTGSPQVRSYELFSVTCQDTDNGVQSEIAVGDSITALGNFDDGGDLGVDLKGLRGG